MTTDQTNPREQVRSLVDRAVTTAVPAADMVERKIRPESEFGYPEPRPLAGLQAALLVARLANDRAYRFAKDLRGEGTHTWDEIADLLGIPWSDDYVRRERAYELVGGDDPAQRRRGAYADVRVYWACAGPRGCGKYITDRGPYDPHPRDNQDGHAEGCARLAADVARYEWEQEERDRRERVMAAAEPKVTDSFGQETIKRVRYVESHGGRYLGWSTSESLMVALVLDDQEQLAAEGYPTKKAALARVVSGLGSPPANPQAWLRQVRAAATGRR
jgi:hypothetical protein